MIEQTLQWDDFFDNVTEDLSTLYWALDTWPPDPREYTPTYVLIQMLSGYERLRQALKYLKKIKLSEDYEKYTAKLAEKYHGGEDRLKALFSTSLREIETLFQRDGEPYHRLLAWEKHMERMTHLHQDRILFDNPESFEEDMLEAAPELLLPFGDMRWAARSDLPHVKNIEGFQAWAEKVRELEGRLQRLAEIVPTVRSEIERMEERQYGVEWWIPRADSEQGAREPELSDNLLQAMGVCLVSSEGSHCPSGDDLMAYALDELRGERREQVHRHLESCGPCLEVVLHARFLNADALPEETAPHGILARLRDVMAQAFGSYDALVERMKSIAPGLHLPPREEADDHTWIERAGWSHQAQAAFCDMGDAPSVTGKLVEIRDENIQKVSPLHFSITHCMREGSPGIRVLAGRVELPASVLSNALLVCSWMPPRGELIHSLEDGVRLNAETGEFSVVFSLSDKPAGEPCLLVLAHD